MTREDSIRQIENYPPFNEQEEKDKTEHGLPMR
jgi:hypothetical protein